MLIARFTPFALATAVLAGCGDNRGAPDFPVTDCSKVTATHCVEIAGGDAAALQAAANSIDGNTALVLGQGTFAMTNQLTIRTAGTHIIGQGIDATTLDFGAAGVQVNGVDAIGNDFLIQDVTVLDSPKDGIRVEASNGVVFRRIRATWTRASSSSNGAYGIYPVKSQNVLVEDSRAENAADAGLYVGQCQHVIVRNNTVTGNVAGLEIENTQFADVYNNTAQDNTGGIVVFDLPGNPIIGRDVRVRNNTIRNNNHKNFAAGGTVASIPVGTGTFAMASRRVEITNNTYSGNNTGDIAIISGLAIEGNVASWTQPAAALSGSYADLGLLTVENHPELVMNFRSENIVIAGNTHAGSGTKPDVFDPLHIGLLLAAHYGAQPVDSVLYDGIMETVDAEYPAGNTNLNHICAAGNTAGTFATLALDQQLTTPVAFYRPAAPFPPFDCSTLVGGPVAPVVLP